MFENGEGKSINNNNTYYRTDLFETRRSSLLRWLKDIFSTTPSPHYRKSFEEISKKKKDGQMSEILQRLAGVLESLNKHLKESKDYSHRVPLHAKSLSRYKREVSVHVSQENNENTKEINKSNVITKEATSKDKKNAELKGKLIARTDITDKSIKDKSVKKEDTTTKLRSTNDKVSTSRTEESRSKDVPANDKNTPAKDNKTPVKDKIVPMQEKNISLRETKAPAKSQGITKESSNESKNKTSPEDMYSSENKNSSIETKTRTDKEPLKIGTAVRNESSSEEDIAVIEHTTIDNNTEEEEENILRQLPIYVHGKKKNIIEDTESGRRSPSSAETTPSVQIKEKLLTYLGDMFDDLARKIQPLTRVKIALSPDNSYRIGYIVANIDTLEIKLKRLRRDMSINKNYWDEAKTMELFDQLRVTNSVVAALMDTLASYLEVPII